MKLVIAAPLYPPEVGGPSYYAEGLTSGLRQKRNTVRVISFGPLKQFPTGIRHFLYACKLLPALWSADAVIALDTFSVAVPAAFLCSLARVPFFIRTGGDFLWEQYLERTNELVLLRDFYTKDRNLSRKERLIFALTRYALARAFVIFSTEMQRTIWLEPYGLTTARTAIIDNAVETALPAEEPRQKNFLWYVRPTAMKNAAHVRAAFAKARESHPDIVLEEDAVPKKILLERMKSCYAVILPSVTEISPNYILDALRFKKPFIMDKYSGLASRLAPYGLLVDPLDEDDIARAVERLAEPEGHEEALAKAAKFSFIRTYDDVAADFMSVLQKRI